MHIYLHNPYIPPLIWYLGAWFLKYMAYLLPLLYFSIYFKNHAPLYLYIMLYICTYLWFTINMVRVFWYIIINIEAKPKYAYFKLLFKYDKCGPCFLAYLSYIRRVCCYIHIYTINVVRVFCILYMHYRRNALLLSILIYKKMVRVFWYILIRIEAK